MTSPDIEAAAQALYREYDDGKTPMNFPWSAIPEVSRQNFRRIAGVVVSTALGVDTVVTGLRDDKPIDWHNWTTTQVALLAWVAACCGFSVGVLWCMP